MWRFSIVDVEHFRSDAQELIGAFDLGLAAASERAAGVAPVADVAVGHGHELDMMPLGRPQGADACGPDFAIVGVSAETDDAQLAVVRRRGQAHGRLAACRNGQIHRP